MNIEKATASEGDDLIVRIQQAAIERSERGKAEGRNHVQQFFYEASLQPELKFRRVCSWCQLVLEEGDPGAPTSHSCCDKCKAGLMPSKQKVAA